MCMNLKHNGVSQMCINIQSTGFYYYTLWRLVFICQPFGRVPVSFISGGPYGPEGVLSGFEGGEVKIPPKK